MDIDRAADDYDDHHDTVDTASEDGDDGDKLRLEDDHHLQSNDSKTSRIFGAIISCR